MAVRFRLSFARRSIDRFVRLPTRRKGRQRPGHAGRKRAFRPHPSQRDRQHTMSADQPVPRAFSFTRQQVFEGAEPAAPFFELTLEHPITLFVGRNGSGKSKTVRLIGREPGVRLLATDRLSGLITYQSTGYTSFFDPAQQRGVPLGPQEQAQTRQHARQWGTATDELYAMREEPEVAIRVAAFVRRALGRSVELREESGFLEPYIRVGNLQYSLLKEEGHGLRELVVLLAATYRTDWQLLVVDEPELHLHPSLARLWLSELQGECVGSARHGIVVTHEPTLVRPLTRDDLHAIVLFSPTRRPTRIGDITLPEQEHRINGSLSENPELVSLLAFSPRPVLVEGKHDVAALSTIMQLRFPPEQTAQTDFVDCGGTTGVATWFEIATKLDLDVRAVADLDALYDGAVSRTLDSLASAQDRLRNEFKIEPPTFSEALKPLHSRMSREGVPADPRHKAEWTSQLADDGDAARRDALLGVLREAGVWLHPQGRLEQVLNIERKGVTDARHAAMDTGPLDKVAEWCAFGLDVRGDVRALLDVAVERIAAAVITAQGLDPGVQLTAPIGAAAASDAKLVSLAPLGNGEHRMTVVQPAAFAGWWVEFGRDTPLSALTLHAPPAPERDTTGGAVTSGDANCDPSHFRTV